MGRWTYFPFLSSSFLKIYFGTILFGREQGKQPVPSNSTSCLRGDVGTCALRYSVLSFEGGSSFDGLRLINDPLTGRSRGFFFIFACLFVTFVVVCNLFLQ